MREEIQQRKGNRSDGSRNRLNEVRGVKQEAGFRDISKGLFTKKMI